jgi:hypothetical protein
VNVNDGRYENGAWSSIYNSPDMVEEVKGHRGSRRRGNLSRFPAKSRWSPALEPTRIRAAWRGAITTQLSIANDWFNNFNGTGKSYDNRNLYSARLGGPVIKNKTFFFALFSGQRDLKRSQATGTTFTDMAKAAFSVIGPASMF